MTMPTIRRMSEVRIQPSHSWYSSRWIASQIPKMSVPTAPSPARTAPFGAIASAID